MKSLNEIKENFITDGRLVSEWLSERGFIAVERASALKAFCCGGPAEGMVLYDPQNDCYIKTSS
jgi:hypothetical protein